MRGKYYSHRPTQTHTDEIFLDRIYKMYWIYVAVRRGLINIGEGVFEEIMNALIISLMPPPMFNPARWIELPPCGNVKQS